MTIEEFLAYQPDDDTCYELENGELREMPPECDLNQRIASFLFAYFLQLGIPFYCLRIGLEVAVTGSKASVRVPDLTVLSDESALALEGASRSTITLDMPPPELVIEVVSPGKENIDRDYRYKRSQYQAREIREYWIVDPLTEKITIFTMNEGLYDEAVYGKADEFSTPLMQRFQADATLSVNTVLQIIEG
ncbi:MAG: Uma2 family endonuclease [Synechococcaceae cyanobacterium RL_1_2]|nr:Uma2 family endonuclease [Synechococcaceae cyanobacterium RL_1_2]